MASAQDTLKLTFIGDVMQHGPQIKSAYDSESGTYDYTECFQYLKTEMSQSDITIANLEFTLAGPPYQGYPMFSAPDATVSALKDAGVDILVTANNHTCDRRKNGVIRTLDVLDSLEIGHTGSFRNQTEKDSLYPMLIEEKGFRLALLNYTYGTNGMPIEEPTRVNLIAVDSIKADLAEAAKMEVDKVIVFVHWGSEYTHKPNQKQKDWAQLFFDHGADIVIGAHSHVVQPMIFQKQDSIISERLLVYSLGNFISNQRTAPRDGGAMVDLSLVKDELGVRVDDVAYRLTWVWLPIRDGKRKYYVLPAEKYEQNKQMMDTWSHNKMKKYIETARGVLEKENVNVPEIRSQN